MDQNAKSQAVEQIKQAQNVLITVSANPSVDQLAAAIGFTLLLNKLDKHATAVFSGQIPSTIEFLKPEDTLEQTTDSLRDFIISLDKAKADKLRYKVEDEVVRIFITPYRTRLSENDLIFSQGDFNVDAVIALGVDNKEHIDQAIMAHGRILHDASVIGIMAGSDPVDVGSVNWQDPNASSLCEMLMSISESLKSGIVDSQIATAFLTGIVATTDRFKNDKTTPKVMTMSAQLMAAGANQQLIANELTPPEPPPVPVEEDQLQEPAPIDEEAQNDDGEGVISLHHYGEDHEQAEPPEQEATEEVEDHHINIDDTGDFSNAEQLREAVEQVQEHKYKLKGHARNIQPLDRPEESIVDESYKEGAQEDEASDDAQADIPLPGEEIRPASTDEAEAASEVPEQYQEQERELELSLPEPETPEELPQINHQRWGKRATYLDHPPSTDTTANDEFSVPAEEELPSIEQAGEQNYAKYITDAPSSGSPLNATEATPPEQVIDPLAAIPQAGPLGANENVSTESPLLSTQHDAESPRATEVPTTESARLSDDGETDVYADRPLGPVVDENSTLSEIESNVEEFENEVSDQGLSADVSEEEARKAVMDAINLGPPSPYGESNQNIGAQFVPLDSQPQVVDPTVLPSLEGTPQQSPDMPPSVPPPLMPPFPIPGLEVVEPSDDQPPYNR